MDVMASLHDLRMGDIIVAPSYLHPFLREQLIEENQGCIGIHLHSFYSLLTSWQKEEPQGEIAIISQYRKLIKEMLPSLSIYKETASSLPFLQECYAFIEDMKTWDISIDQLPRETASQKELYAILFPLYPITTSADIQKKTLEKRIHHDFSNIYLYDASFSLKEQKLVDFFMEHGAKLIPMQQVCQKKQFYHAVNKRQEIEGCAQYILQHDISAQDIQITLADTTYAPIVKQIFERYQIPHTFLSNSHTSIITKRFHALFQYYLRPDEKHFLNCLDCGCFVVEGIESLRSYLEIFPGNITTPFDHLQTIDYQGHVLSPLDLEKLLHLQQKAEEVRQQVTEKLHPFLIAASIEEVFLSICELVKETLSTQHTELQVFLKVQNFLNDVFPYLENMEDFTFYLPYLDKISYDGSIKEMHGAIVTSLTQNCPKKQYQFILGATQNNYPAFSFKKGIFDESYYQFLPYPSMEDRYAHYLKQLEKQLWNAPVLIVSYPLGTYEGKSLEAALEIEQMLGKPESYPLHTSYVPMKTSLEISPQIAKQLFVKDDVLKGSISSLERYIHCPFSYFLRYGLGLREPMQYTFSDSYAGTLSHYVLETLTKTMGKEYAKATSDKIEQLLHKEIEEIKEIFPSSASSYSLLEKRLFTNLTQTLQRLEDMEEHSHLKPWKQEEPFTYILPVKEDVKLQLYGIIDRIDADGNLASILDYKSSIKTLSEPKVFAALQLQLLTYSIVVKKMHKEVLGAYYVSLKNENIPNIAGQLKRRPVSYTEIGKEEKEALLKKAHRRNGWTMSYQVDILDDDASHIAGVRQNKDGIIKAGKTYSLDQIEKYFTTIYQKIADRILSADISLTPDEDACTFCKYYEICRFHGLYTKKEPFIEPDDALYRKEEEIEDATME